MKTFILIIAITSITLQVLFIVKNDSGFFLTWKKRMLYKKILKFQEDNFDKLTLVITSYDNSINHSETIIDIFDKHFDLSNKVFNEDTTYNELKNEFLKLKITYGEYLPEVKKEMRNKNIDSILNN